MYENKYTTSMLQPVQTGKKKQKKTPNHAWISIFDREKSQNAAVLDGQSRSMTGREVIVLPSGWYPSLPGGGRIGDCWPSWRRRWKFVWIMEEAISIENIQVLDLIQFFRSFSLLPWSFFRFFTTSGTWHDRLGIRTNTTANIQHTD